MQEAFICDAVRTPIGSYGGCLSGIRTDDLAAIPIKKLVERNPSVNWSKVDDVVYGCVNQAGEDSRNVARMAALLSGLDTIVGGVTVNRLCGSGMDAVGIAARSIKLGEAELLIAGGVESMSRAPYVVAKSTAPFARDVEMFDSTIGWRFINKIIKNIYGVDSMPETAENLVADYGISRLAQDEFAVQSQKRVAAAILAGNYKDEIIPVFIPQKKGEDIVLDQDEYPKPNTTLEAISKLKAPFRENGTVTAANSSGVNDGSCALLIASANAAKEHNLTPKARIIAMATAGVQPRIMGIGPVPAIHKVLKIAGLKLEQMDVIELNEAFAVQALAVLHDLGIASDALHVNPNGGAIALGHPLGMSGARLVTTAMYQLQRTAGRYALCSMCIGVGQGIALIIERV